MHSLNPNRAIPQPLQQILLHRTSSSRALPSATSLLELVSRLAEDTRLCLRLRGEELGAERWAGGAEEGAGCGHFVTRGRSAGRGCKGEGAIETQLDKRVRSQSPRWSGDVNEVEESRLDKAQRSC